MNKNKVAPLGFEPRPNGLEPLVLPLHHRANLHALKDSNLQPVVLETTALPIELKTRVLFIPKHHNHAWEWCCILTVTKL